MGGREVAFEHKHFLVPRSFECAAPHSRGELLALMESKLLPVKPKVPDYLDGFCVTQQSLKRESRVQSLCDEMRETRQALAASRNSLFKCLGWGWGRKATSAEMSLKMATT